MSNFLSVDPGKRGAAVLWQDGKPVKVIPFYHTPEWWMELYWLCVLHRPEFCVKERIHEFKGQGISTTVIFVRADTKAETVLQILGIKIILVEPQEWQRTLGVPHFHQYPDRNKRRTERGKWLKSCALENYPELKEFDKKLPNACGDLDKKGRIKEEAPDIWAAVAIGASYSRDWF